MKKIAFLSLALLYMSCQKDNNNKIVGDTDLDALKNQQLLVQKQADSLQKLSIELSQEIAARNPNAAKLVKYKVAKDTVYQHFFNIQASVETDQDIAVTPEFGGVLTLLVKEGQFVRKGQLIARISDGGLAEQVNQAKIQVNQAKAQLAQAEIQRDLAKTTFEKQQKLWNKNIGSEIQFLQAKTNYETAQKQVLAARQQVSAAQRGVAGSQSQLAKTKLMAPFSGKVEQIITQSGQVVGPGVPVIRLINPSNLKAVGNVPETYLPYIEKGTKAIVHIPSLSKTFESKVSLVSASINPGNRSFQVEVSIPSNVSNVKPNLNAELELNDYTSENAFIIEETAIREDSRGKYVFVVENENESSKIAKKVYIETGEASNGILEIKSGITSGQIIITEAPAKLQEGDIVELAN